MRRLATLPAAVVLPPRRVAMLREQVDGGTDMKVRDTRGSAKILAALLVLQVCRMTQGVSVHNYAGWQDRSARLYDLAARVTGKLR
jgi:hypothetical protein